MKRVSGILILFFICFHCIKAQITFEKTYDFWDNSSITGILPISDGYILFGRGNQIQDKKTFEYFNFLIRTDIYGDTMFTKTYSTAHETYGDQPFFIADQDSIFYLAYNSSPESYVQKFNNEGNVIWTKPLPTSKVLDFIKTSDGNFVFISDMDCCFQITKINPEVEVIWANLINATDTSYLSGKGAFEIDTIFNWPATINSITEVPDGQYKVAVNYSSNYNEHSTNQYLFIIGSDGRYVDKKEILSSMPWPHIHKLMNYDSDLIVLGCNDYNIFYVSRLNSSEDTIWTRHYLQGIRWGYFDAITVTSDGNFVMAGAFMEQQNENVGLLSFTPQGDYLWHKQYSGGHLPVAWHVVSCDDGGFAAGGNVGDWNQEIAYFIKTDAYGNINGPGIHENDPVSLLKLYPNPAVNLVYLEMKPDYQSIEIFDLSGRLVYSRDLSDPLENEISIRVDGFLPGIYLVQVNSTDAVFTDKLAITCHP